MIEYTLKDEYDNTYSLNGSLVTTPLKNSWTQKNDTFAYENHIVEKTYLAGAIKVSDSRIESRDFALGVSIANDNATTFRVDVNTLVEFISRTKYLVDETNDIQIEISVLNVSIEYDKGSLKHSADITVEFTALTPYWEATTVDQITGTTLADTIKELFWGYLVRFLECTFASDSYVATGKVMYDCCGCCLLHLYGGIGLPHYR